MPRALLFTSPVVAAVVVTMAGAQPPAPTAARFEALPYAPRTAVCYRTPTPLTIDGRLDEPAWRAAPASDRFVDIDGVRQPSLATHVKMLWDDEFFYVAAEMEEPHVWGTLTTRDAVIFQDPDFEVFIDPDGDTHNYYELEINALNTVWDLMLPTPYRDGGPAVHAWDIAGLRTGVQVQGTINRPGDRDQGWTVEIAMPWSVLREAAPGRTAPKDGDRWRVNFSRVEWQVDVVDQKDVKGAKDDGYRKRTNGATGKPLPEDNWVWSPQGAINMHMPERWGVVQFSSVPAGTTAVRFVPDPNDPIKWQLRRLYYRQRDYYAANGRYATTIDDLGPRLDGTPIAPTIQATGSLFEIAANGANGTVVHIRQDGKLWTTGARP